MDPALQQQLAAYIKAILATAQSGAAFVAEQAPLVVQEKIAYGRLLFPVEAIGFAIAGVVLARLSVKFYRIASESGGRYGDIWPERKGGLLNMLTACGACLCSVFALMSAETAMQVWFAPRLYILEWALSLVKH